MLRSLSPDIGVYCSDQAQRACLDAESQLLVKLAHRALQERIAVRGIFLSYVPSSPDYEFIMKGITRLFLSAAKLQDLSVLYSDYDNRQRLDQIEARLGLCSGN